MIMSILFFLIGLTVLLLCIVLYMHYLTWNLYTIKICFKDESTLTKNCSWYRVRKHWLVFNDYDLRKEKLKHKYTYINLDDVSFYEISIDWTKEK